MKAIIPVAGFGTRLFPATKSIKKSFIPIMDKDGEVKPAILILLEQLDKAGIDEICLVIGDGEQEEYNEFFKPLALEHFNKLSDDKKIIEENIVRIGKKITYVVQHERKGFGHAVYLCKDFVGNEPFLLLLGDTLYTSDIDDNCTVQMIKAYNKYKMPIIATQPIDVESVVHYGIMHGTWIDDCQNALMLDEIKEKPSIDYAKEHLSVKSNKSNDSYYVVFGQYILLPDIFDILAKDVEDNNSNNKEIELTSALEKLRSNVGAIGYVIQGDSYDVGMPDAYYDTMVNYSK